MKSPKYIAMLVFVLVAVLLHPSAAMASAQRTTFTGTSNFGETLNVGAWTYLPSGNVLARGIVETYHDVNTDPRVTGEETIVSRRSSLTLISSLRLLPSLAWRVICGALSTSKMRAGRGMAPLPARSPQTVNTSTAASLMGAAATKDWSGIGKPIVMATLGHSHSTVGFSSHRVKAFGVKSDYTERKRMGRNPLALIGISLGDDNAYYWANEP